MNQLDENYFSCDFFYYQVKNLLKTGNFFLIKSIENDWSCTTMENLRYLNSVVNEIIYYSKEDWQGIV